MERRSWLGRLVLASERSGARLLARGAVGEKIKVKRNRLPEVTLVFMRRCSRRDSKKNKLLVLCILCAKPCNKADAPLENGAPWNFEPQRYGSSSLSYKKKGFHYAIKH